MLTVDDQGHRRISEGHQGKVSSLGIIHQLKTGNGVSESNRRRVLDPLLADLEEATRFSTSCVVLGALPEGRDGHRNRQQTEERCGDHHPASVNPSSGVLRHGLGELVLDVCEPTRVAFTPEGKLAVGGAGPE